MSMFVGSSTALSASSRKRFAPFPLTKWRDSDQRALLIYRVQVRAPWCPFGVNDSEVRSLVITEKSIISIDVLNVDRVYSIPKRVVQRRSRNTRPYHRLSLSCHILFGRRDDSPDGRSWHFLMFTTTPWIRLNKLFLPLTRRTCPSIQFHYIVHPGQSGATTLSR